MLHCLVIVTAALFSKFALKNIFRFHHWLGIGLMIVGMVLAGVSSLVTSKSGNTFPIGVILVLVGNCFLGIEYIV